MIAEHASGNGTVRVNCSFPVGDESVPVSDGQKNECRFFVKRSPVPLRGVERLGEVAEHLQP
eukprot:2458294-Pleurochrysis_carterae.AAC.1